MNYRNYCPLCKSKVEYCECEGGLHLFGDTHGYTWEDRCTSREDCDCIEYWESERGIKEWKAIVEKIDK